jgi:hypothetical protein
MTDHDTLTAIHAAMSGKVWSADTLDRIAGILNRAGWTVADKAEDHADVLAMTALLPFEQFIAAGRDVADVYAVIGADGDPTPGRVYPGGFFILREADGSWNLPLANDEYCGALPDLERELYDYAREELGS